MSTEQERRQRAAEQRAELAQAIVAELGKLAPDATVTWPGKRPSAAGLREDRDAINVARDGYTATIYLSNSGRRFDGPACGTVRGVGDLHAVTNASPAGIATRALANLAEQHAEKLRQAAKAEQRSIAEQRRAESRQAIEAACPEVTGKILRLGPLWLSVEPGHMPEPSGSIKLSGILRPEQIAALVEAVRAALAQTADVAQEA